MAPLVRYDKGPLERQEIARDERFEEKRIGHAVHRRALEIQIEERELGPSRHREADAAEIALCSRECARELCRVVPDAVRVRIERVDALDRRPRQGVSGVSRHAARLELQFVGERNAAIVQPPDDEKRKIDDRRQHEGPDNDGAGPAPPGAARRAGVAHESHDPAAGDRRDQNVEQRKRRPVRDTGEHALLNRVHAGRIQALDDGRGGRHQRGGGGQKDDGGLPDVGLRHAKIF